MNATTIRNGVIAILLVDAIMIGTIVGATVSWRAGLLAGAGAIVVPAVLVPFCVWGFARMTRWRELARLYPSVEPGPNAPRARIASISVRRWWIGLNNCVTLCPDDDHLHVRVMLPLVPGLSVPWAAVSELTERRMSTELTLIEGPSIWVPKWAAKQELEVRGVEVDGAEVSA